MHGVRHKTPSCKLSSLHMDVVSLGIFASSVIAWQASTGLLIICQATDPSVVPVLRTSGVGTDVGTCSRFRHSLLHDFNANETKQNYRTRLSNVDSFCHD